MIGVEPEAARCVSATSRPSSPTLGDRCQLRRQHLIQHKTDKPNQ
eukprot:SAG22_NODE_14268_length_379_cov_2.635714_1_plen_44_part_01